MVDNVKHPQHYREYPKEIIDVIKFILGEEGFIAYCMGNEIKYRMRAGFKNDVKEDMDKAFMYKKFRDEFEASKNKWQVNYLYNKGIGHE